MRQILNIAYYEVQHIFKDKILFLIVFVAPLAYTAFFGMIYISAFLHDIPLGIVNLDHSDKSLKVVEAFENMPYFTIVSEISSYEDMEKGMREGIIRAGVVIPEDYSKKLSQHQQAEIITVYDGSNLVCAFNIRKYLQQVLNTFSVEQTSAYLAGMGMTKQEIVNVMDTVSFSMQVWYNPTLSYVTYLFMGIVIMILHQIGLMGITLSVTREKQQRTWLQFLSASIPSRKIFVGKALPYFIMNFFNYGLVLWIADRFVNVKIDYDVALMLLLGLLFSLVIISIGFIISLLASDTLQVTRFLLLLSLPLFVLSGYTWPSTHMPAFLNALADLMPYTWMTRGFLMVTLKNWGLHDLSLIIAVMGAMAAVGLFVAVRLTKKVRKVL